MGSGGVSLLPAFMVGLLGSVHCAGMCGGIVTALSAARPPQPAPLRRAGAPDSGARMLADVLAYNLGRIASYMLGGALAGGLGAGAAALARLPALQAGGYWLANLMLAMLGLYLMDAWRGLARLEQGGQFIWRRVAPLLRHLRPAPGAAVEPARMLAAGLLWGWLPCGMVYSVLVTAMLSGSALDGALVMLAFGAGTLPMLLGLGLLGARLRACLRLRGVRLACGAVVLGFGLLGLARAAGGLPHSWIASVCVAPGAQS